MRIPNEEANKNGAVTSAVLVHLTRGSAHFDWRWRERPAPALLAWDACSQSTYQATPHPIRLTVTFSSAVISPNNSVFWNVRAISALCGPLMPRLIIDQTGCHRLGVAFALVTGC